MVFLTDDTEIIVLTILQHLVCGIRHQVFRIGCWPHINSQTANHITLVYPSSCTV